MTDIHLIPGQQIHLIGIGGFGMSAIARILLKQGYMVSGSDTSTNAHTQALKALGVTIYKGHDPVYVANAEIVIRSSAIPDDHIEVMSALSQDIPVFKRADIISTIMGGDTCIAIAGTHGKTTTTSMTTHVLIETGQSPSYIVGGILENTGLNADLGNGKVFVIEADEYDNMFHGLRPQVEVITNVEYDHPDFFRTPRDVVESFSHFVGLLPRDGLLVVCADDPTALIFGENRIIVDLPTVTYGIHNQRAKWRASDLRHDFGVRFDVVCDDQTLGSVRLSVPGQHNVLNALAALAVTHHLGVPFQEAAQALASFKGAGRRFELSGEVQGVAVISDYAHHPTEIQVTLQAARQRYPNRTIWAVWQPHTFSRTQKLLDRYLTAFKDADHVLVTDIYAARETRRHDSITGAAVVEAMRHLDARYTADLDDAAALLLDEVTAPAVIVILSAGSAPQVGEAYLTNRRVQLGIATAEDPSAE